MRKAEKKFIEFCKQCKALPSCNYNIPPAEYSIPPVLHFIWLGSPLPSKASLIIESWQRHHPGWDIKIWMDEQVAHFPWTDSHVELIFNQAESWAEKADILRLDILYQFGGIYSDIDVVCLRSFHDLIMQDITFFSCFELNYTSRHYGDAFYIGTAVLGAAKGSPLMRDCLELARTRSEAPGVGILKRTGPGLVSRVCERALEDTRENILILPCSYLYPFPWKERDKNSRDFISFESLAIHLWDNSWM